MRPGRSMLLTIAREICMGIEGCRGRTLQLVLRRHCHTA
jgi:hypothetical protein